MNAEGGEGAEGGPVRSGIRRGPVRRWPGADPEQFPPPRTPPRKMINHLTTSKALKGVRLPPPNKQFAMKLKLHALPVIISLRVKP